MTMQ